MKTKIEMKVKVVHVEIDDPFDPDDVLVRLQTRK